MTGKDYGVAAAFQAIEYELINSFFRNMKKHKVDEVKEQKQWEMWQVKQLQELDAYKRRNAKKYGTKFTDINKTIAEMIRLSNEEGQMDQEAEILSAMEKGLKPQRAPEQMTAQFFRTNDRKLDTLINATVSDMEKAEVAVLRKADDVYRKTIFNAMVYANTGAGTYEKAVDMATKDFMKAGLTCVEYKNGSKHTLSDYADMAIRTANKRAYLQGEGAKRQEWGVHTVIVNRRLNACPHCMPFAGKVFIDDVWGGGSAADGNYPLLSEAVAAGLYHPRCKDSHTAFFPGISDNPKRYTKQEVKEAEKQEEQERKADYAERQAESYQRVADTRLDPENKRTEQAKTDRWSDLAGNTKKSKKEDSKNIIKQLREHVEVARTVHRCKKDFQKGLANMPDSPEKTLLAEAYMLSEIKGDSSDDSVWNTVSKSIVLGRFADDETLAHELFHEMDQHYNLTKDGLLQTSIWKDFFELQLNAKKANKSIEQYLVINFKDAFLSTQPGNEVLKPEFSRLSDILHGCSNGAIDLGYGHYDTDYWMSINALQKETLAHHGAILYNQNEKVIEMYSKLFRRSKREITLKLRELV